MINIRTDTTNYLINLDDQPGRLASATMCLDDNAIPFIRFAGIKHERGIVGCGMSHRKLLSQIKPKTLIFEDDIDVTAEPIKIIDVPLGTDAVYLGVSTHGYVTGYKNGIGGTVLATQVDLNYKRVYNMCSAHAVLYLSERYIKAAYDMANYCINHDIPWDLGIASQHKYFNILTPNNPWFYQIEQKEATYFTVKC